VSEPSGQPPMRTAAERPELAALLAQMGAVLLSHETVETTVELVTTLAAEAIPGAAGAGVTLVDERGKRSIASSNDLVSRADALQYQLDAGPCLTSWRQQLAVRIDDVTQDTRWPDWSAAAGQTGVRAVLSHPLVAGDACVGAIKVYATHPGAFDPHAQHLLALFARQAAILLVNSLTVADAHRSNSELSEALQAREILGLAKGILLARGAADETAAFALLVGASQRSHTKLHQLARRLVESVVRRNADDHPRR
jgi:GAF domain-containing protein